MCNGVVDQTEPLTGADPSALRLRLVNGWVWINDLTSGTLWIAGTDTELERIDDWGNTLGSEGDEPDDNPGDQEDGDTEENPDIGEIRDPEIDEDGVNEPPVARDDVARTRADQPVVVDLRRQRRRSRRRRADGRRARRGARPRWPSPSRPTSARCRSCLHQDSPATSISPTR